MDPLTIGLRLWSTSPRICHSTLSRWERKSFDSRVGRSSQNIHGADGERMGDGGLVDRWCRLLSVLPSRRWIVVGWLFQVCRPGSNEGETHRRRRLDLVDVVGEWSSATALHAAVAKRTPHWRPAVSTISGQHALKPRQSCTFSHVLWLTPPCTANYAGNPSGVPSRGISQLRCCLIPRC